MDLNDKEKKVLKAFPEGEPITLAELARKAFPGMGAKSTTRGHSWVRNSIRRPVRLKMVKQLGRGLYLKSPTATAKKATRSPKKTTRTKTPKNSARTTVVGEAQASA